MRPAARIQAAIEVLTTVLGGAAADRALQSWGRAHRFAGSGDRRAIADHVYAALRHGPGQGDARATMIAGLAAQGVAKDTIEDLFEGGAHAPAPLSPAERELLDAPPAPAPAWLMASLRRAFGDCAEIELESLSRRAALDLRVNTLKTDRAGAAELLAAEGIAALDLPLPDTALSVLAGSVDVDGSETYALGFVEIQDSGSQIAAALVEARPGVAVLDLCAGAGGKTLALAAQMKNSGRLLATDTGEIRLRRLGPRAARAGATIVETRLLPGDWPENGVAGRSPFSETFDRVLVDAPCSGSGTWRRNPETRARLTQGSLAALAEQQNRLLDAAAPLVAAGGRLVYVTCSVLPEEGEDVAAAFLARHGTFAAEPIQPIYESVFGRPPPRPLKDHLRLSPAADGTDGFFVTVFTRRP